jgi:cytochrome subunit of sulfide dehydrogenase
MPNNPFRKAFLIAGLTLAVSSVGVAQEKQAPPPTLSGADAVMLANTCAGCHGTDGASVGPASPTIAGMSKAYFVEVMKGFADDSIYSTIMGRIAKGYTEDEINLMADYFAAKPFVKAKQTSDKKEADKGAKLHDKYCEKCHADGGSSAEDDSGILAGQWVPYLHYAMEDFKAGKREMPKKMKQQYDKMMEKDGEAGLKSLMNFYASQK